MSTSRRVEFRDNTRWRRPSGGATADRGWIRGVVGGRRRPLLDGASILLYHFDVDEADRERFALRRLGAEVAVAVSLGDALAIVERQRPVAVVSARVAVTPSGYDCGLLRALRALPTGRGWVPPAVALTPWAGDEARDAILALGFHGHVGGPCTPASVAAEISRVALGRAMAAGARR